MNTADEITSLKFYADSTGDMTGTIKVSGIKKSKPVFYTYSHSWGGTADIQSNKAEFPGSSGESITVTDAYSDMIVNTILGTGELTIEIDVYADVSQNQSYFGIGNGGAGWPTGTSNGHMFIMIQNGSNSIVQWSKPSTGLGSVSGAGTFVGAEGRFTFVRDGTNVSIYKNGTRLATSTTDIEVAYTATTGSRTIHIGGNAVSGEELDGRINAIRISRKALYDATSSTITDLALTNDADTVYLNTFTGSNGTTPTDNTMD